MARAQSEIVKSLGEKNVDELRLIAKKLRISGYSNYKKHELIERLSRERKIGEVLFPSFWSKHHNHIYGVATLLAIPLAILLWWIPPDTSVSKQKIQTNGTGSNASATIGKADGSGVESGSSILVGSVEMQFCTIPAGVFEMGSTVGLDAEKPTHLVSVKEFELSMFEITQKQYENLMGDNPSSFTASDHPVTNVNWFDAVIFCNALSIHESIAPYYAVEGSDVTIPVVEALGYRLPTEAEWEYACRAGSQTEYCFGNNPDDLHLYAWYTEGSGLPVHPVGEKLANDWGLHDMHGNVFEWCWDWYEDDYYSEAARTSPQMDPMGPVQGKQRVTRGGSCHKDYSEKIEAKLCRSAHRSGSDPTGRWDNLGFRVARNVRSTKP